METLTLADGRVIDLTGKEMAVSQPFPLPKKIAVHRQLVDLPLSGGQMHLVALIAAYSVWGLRVQDIAELMKVEVARIDEIRATDIYVSFYNELLRSVLDSELEDVRDQIVTMSRAAIKKVEDILNDDEDSKTVLNAARDLLDRAGLRPVDVIEHKHKLEGALTIVHVKRGELPAQPIDVEFEEINGDRS